MCWTHLSIRWIFPSFPVTLSLPNTEKDTRRPSPWQTKKKKPCHFQRDHIGQQLPVSNYLSFWFVIRTDPAKQGSDSNHDSKKCVCMCVCDVLVEIVWHARNIYTVQAELWFQVRKKHFIFLALFDTIIKWNRNNKSPLSNKKWLSRFMGPRDITCILIQVRVGIQTQDFVKTKYAY